MSVELILIRHGQGRHNLPPKDYGVHKDAELTAQGEDEARRLGTKLQAAGVDFRRLTILASPLSRAQRTAKLAFGRDPVTLEDARERFVKGHLCNLVFGEPKDMVHKHETDDEIKERAARVVAHIKGLGNGTVALVTHALFIRALLSLVGHDQDKDTWLGNAEFVVVRL